MSGVEILGIVASVAQVADLGARLSVKLFTFSRTVKSAQQRIQSVSEEVAVTSTVLKQLGDELRKDAQGQLYSAEARTTTEDIVIGCRETFTKIELLISTNGQAANSSTSIADWKKRLKFTFLEPRIDGIRGELEKYKSSLLLMLNVLILAGLSRIPCPAQRAESVAARLAFSDAAGLLRDPAQEQSLETPEIGTDMDPASSSESTKELDQYTSTKLPSEAAQASSPSQSPGLQKDNPVSHISAMSIHGPSRKHSTLTQNHPLRQLTDDKAEVRSPIRERLSDEHSTDTIKTSKSSRELVHSLYGRDLQQHAALVSKLVAEISSKAHMDIDLGIRDRMEKRILTQHLEEWDDLRRRVGNDLLLPFLKTHQKLDNYWRRMDFERRVGLPDKVVIEDAWRESPLGVKRFRTERSIEDPSEVSVARDEESIHLMLRNTTYLDDDEAAEFDMRDDLHQHEVKEEETPLTADPSRPAYIRVHQDYLLPEVLEAHRLPWEWDKNDEKFIIIKTYIDRDLQNKLFEHTRRWKENKLVTVPVVKGIGAATTLRPDTDFDWQKDKVDRIYLLRKKSKDSDERDPLDTQSLDDLLKRFTNLSEQERNTLPSYPEEEARRSWMFT
ncbi:hypothetical protein H2200_009448 [Cladophialophora chaetospira]|uniref:Azaphilone pigments biosynthesis cluster protein L N-terminal domain-containing protein n=1 Tax=Cladophialophora chaetospira TaxID=386627 RepID=A0AA39CFR1_9EURO|nr:hypothetical protein H2200_009448 [Cladophialophora chaetospira]